MHTEKLGILGALAAVSLTFGACADGTSDEVSYHKDIAPLLQQHCVSCHQSGEIAPFTLTSFDDVDRYKEIIGVAVTSRRMPPQNLDNSGDCQNFQDARWMSDEEIALVNQWIDEGGVEGDEADSPGTDLPANQQDAIAPAGEVVDAYMTEPYLPGPSAEYANDDYRCFFVGQPFDTDKFFTGYSVFPQNPAIFHHMLLFAITSDESEARADELAAEDPEAGWSCFGDGGVDDASLVAVWAPGRRTVVYPAGTGMKIKANHRLVMQVHYNLLAGVTSDQSGLQLFVDDSVEKEAVLAPLTHSDFELPPGEASYTTSASYGLLGLGVPLLEVHGIFPHMHLLGRQLEYEVFPSFTDPDETGICLARVNNWDFNWQDTLFYEEPLLISENESVRITCTFDTSERTEPVTWGDGTQDEMCLVFSYLTLPDGGLLPDF